MTRTLRRERIQKFREIVCNSEIYMQCRLDIDALEDELGMLVSALADAAASRTEAQTAEIIKSADKTVDAVLYGEKVAAQAEAEGKAWRGREILVPASIPYGDWFHKVTGLHMYGAKAKPSLNKDWIKAFKEWAENELTIQSLQSAYDVENDWRKLKSGQPQNITTPSQLTAKAIAIQAVPSMVSSTNSIKSRNLND